MQKTLLKIQLLASQSDQFRDAEPVPVSEQNHCGVALTVAPEPPRRGDQPIDLCRCQVFPAAPVGVWNLGRGAHCADFPEKDVWRELRRWAESQAAPHIGSAYFP